MLTAKNAGSQSYLQASSPVSVLETIPVNMEPSPLTLDQKIHALYLKYQPSVAESMILTIISCESSNNAQARHYNKNKTIDYSYFQINSIWKIFFKKKGWDIANPEQNLEAGFYLLKTRGIQDWRFSSDCQKGKSSTSYVGTN